MFKSISAVALALSVASALVPPNVVAQPALDLLRPARSAHPAARRAVPGRRQRRAGVEPTALSSDTVRLTLFDDVAVTLQLTERNRVADDRLVWVGRDGNGAQGVLTLVRGVLTGTVYVDHRAFEITLDTDGDYLVVELDPAAFPTDDPPQEALALDTGGSAAAVATAGDLQNPTPVDVMIVWTPSAEAAAGGRAAMDSLALASVANANLVYTNSLIGARLNLVYAGPIAFTETPSNISGDLTALRGTTDGTIDQVHSIRDTYGADLVTLIGNGYASSGACGIGGLMSTVSTSFASQAFTVVDRTCAVGNLSYAHEVGHNQGLHHDPANASGTPAYAFAYGYQQPSGLFRTVMSYGGAVRIPFFSSPSLLYSERGGEPSVPFALAKSGF